MCFKRKDVYVREVEADRQRWRGLREGVENILSGLGEREKFIISERLV